MKKIFFCLTIAIAFFNYASFAQHKPSADDIGKALKGGRLLIHSSKDLLEASEAAVIDVKLTVVPVVNQETLQTEGGPYDIPLPDGSDPNIPAAYKASNWQIIQGGGSISSINGSNCVYTAPAKAPKDKIMVISVDMIPTSTALPKVILLKTIYFVEDETSIVVNIPAGGFNNTKYVTTTGGGMKVPTMASVDPRAKALIDPGTRAKMEQAQQAVAAAQANTGINLTAITSNSTAFYDGKNDQTLLKFSKLAIQMDGGKDRRPIVNGVRVTPTGTVLTNCSFTFKGNGVGMYELEDKNEGGGLMDGPIKGCGCGNWQPQKEAPCKGYVHVKSVENGIMKGDFTALAYTFDGTALVQGYISGKFIANVANMQQ